MLGITIILLKWPFTGLLIELYGTFVLFGDFIATIAGFVGNVPMVGPYVAAALRLVGMRGGSGGLPV